MHLYIAESDVSVGPPWHVLEVVDDVPLAWLATTEVGMTDHRALKVVRHRTGLHSVEDERMTCIQHEVVDRSGMCDTDDRAHVGREVPDTADTHRVPGSECRL